MPSPLYVPTEEFLRSVQPSWGPAPRAKKEAVVADCSTARRWVREVVDGEAGDVGDRVDDVMLAVHELVANALRAAGAAEVSTWAANGTRVWEVADPGPGLHDVSAGYAPPPLDLAGGRGLWLARCLADEMLVRPHGPGTAVRLHFARS